MALVDQLTRRSPATATATCGEPMINVAHARTAIASVPGEIVAMSKSQYAQLLTEIETGQNARRALTNLRTLVAVAASTSGAPA